MNQCTGCGTQFLAPLTGPCPSCHYAPAQSLKLRLDVLLAERASREARGVPVPLGVTAAIDVLSGQLANEYNRHEADNLDELGAEGEGLPWYAWTVIAGGVLLLAAFVLWMRG